MRIASTPLFIFNFKRSLVSYRNTRGIKTLTSYTNNKIITLPGYTITVAGNLLKVAENNVNKTLHGPTADDVIKNIDLEGKTCLITGANSGIGLEIMRCLLSRNCNILALCRNTYAASVVANNTCENTHCLRHYETNLASLRSVKKCSGKILKDQKKIDIVILNAGIFGLPWTLTEDRLETTFQVNYLSQLYLLTNIEKALAPEARVIFISSESHRNVKWSIDNSMAPTEKLISLSKDQYTAIKAYNISKLCGILTMHYLGYRWLNTGKSVFCAHPGSFISTRLCRNWWGYELLYSLMQPFSKSISQAASTPIYCATSPDLNAQSAQYYKDCQRYEESDLAKDTHLALRLYDLTQEILRDRVASTDGPLAIPSKSIVEEHVMEETLVSNLSG